MAFNAGRVEVHLGAQLERRDFELYEKKLKEIRAQVGKREAFQAQLGGDFNPKAFNAYQRELKRAEHATNDNIKAQGRLRTAFGSVYGRGGAVFAAAGGLYGLVTAGKAVIGTASDINESLTKNQVLFGKYAKGVEQFSKTSAASFGISRKAALEYTGVFGNLFRAFGTSQKQSAEFSTQLTKLAADMASFNNTSIEEALEAIRSGLVGESEPLRKFGVNINETALKAEALASGLVKAHVDQAKMHSSTLALDIAQRNLAKALKEHGSNSDEAKKAQLALENAQQRVNKTAGGQAIQLNAQQKAMAAMQLTTKQTAAAHGDFARTSGGLANQTRILKARFSDIKGQLGDQLLPVMVTITSATNKFIGEVQSGTGAGGRFRDQMESVGKEMVTVGKQFADVAIKAHGHESSILKVAAAYLALRGRVVKAGVALVAAVGIDKAKSGADSVDDVRKRIEGLTSAHNLKGLADLGDALRTLGTKDARRLAREVEEAAARVRTALDFGRIGKDMDGTFALMRRNTRGHMKDILKAVTVNTEIVKDRLGSDTAEGRKALAHNFREAAKQVKKSMDAGVVSTKTGSSEIRDLLIRALQSLGLSREQARAKLDTGTVQTDRGPGAGAGRRAVGGWIGEPGMIGGDIIPAMLAPGEAVLNRHQQAVIEGMLGDGFLDRLFETVDKPHYFAGGGRAGLMGANPGLAPYASFGSQFGLSVTSGLRPGAITSSGNVSLHASGNAIDMDAGTPGGMLAYAKAMAQRFGSGLDELIHTPLGFGIKNGRRVPPYAVADHYDHVHVGDRTPGGAAGGIGAVPKIVAAQIGGSGALQGLVQRAASVSAASGNDVIERVASTIGISSDFGTGGGKLTGGQYGKSQLAALWRRAGGDSSVAGLMAAIALAESGGNPRAHNPSGASGLWQILGVPFPGDPFNPLTNARMAVSKYGSQGLGAWEAYTNGTYRQYLGRGGRAMQFFARGGRAGGSKRKKISVDTLIPAGRRTLPELKAMQKDRIPDYDTMLAKVDDYNTTYGIRERTYDLDVEELIKDDGTVDEGAVRERANELLGLISIRQRIIDQLVSARNLARKIIKTYNTIIRRLRNSLKHAKKKDRSGIKGTINTYTERRDEWAGKLHELQSSTLPSARLDLRELVRERGEVLGTKAEPQEPSEEPTPEEPTPDDTTTDTAAPPSPADIAAAALADLSTFNQSRSELLGSYARNFISAFQAGSPGGVFSGSPDELSKAAGVRFFGAGSTGSSLGGATIINNYNQLPDSTQTWSQQMRFQLEAA